MLETERTAHRNRRKTTEIEEKSMQANHRTRLVLLVATITLAVTGATVTTTTGTFVDREEVTVGEIEADTDGYESASAEGNQSNEANVTAGDTEIESENETTEAEGTMEELKRR